MCPRRAVIICIVVYMDNIFSFFAKTLVRMARRRRQRLIQRALLQIIFFEKHDIFAECCNGCVYVVSVLSYLIYCLCKRVFNDVFKKYTTKRSGSSS